VLAASQQLPFKPIVSDKLGTPFKVLVTEGGDRSHPNFALEFGTLVADRFLVVESPSQTTQAALESLALCDPTQGCEGTRSVRALLHGARGLVVSGPGSNGILWLQNGLLVDVFGPPSTFSVAHAVEVANYLEAS